MIELADVLAAQQRIAAYIKHTPLLRMAALDAMLGFEVYVKPESFQGAGSFKLRGASNKLQSLSEAERKRGVIAASSGNHAQGVAAAAAAVGVDALIVMPVDAPTVKVEGTKALGAKVVMHGLMASERHQRMMELVKEEGRVIVHAYEDPLVMAGQGTAAVEILADEPEMAAIVAPVGGGGLICGLATAAKGLKPGISVIGVEPQGAPRYSVSRAAGQPLGIKVKSTIADGTRVDKAAPVNFSIIEARVDELVQVDDEILKAAIFCYAKLGKLVVEPSGALSMAAALSGQLRALQGKKVCLLVSGGNMNMSQYTAWLSEGAENFAMFA